MGRGNMRKSRQEAADTRERIVNVAAREFNEGGIEGTGLADIMTAAGLTHGGFYKHFSSKDQLVAEAVEQALDRSLLSLEGFRGGRSLESIATEYLSKQHRDEFEEACPLASLGSELRFAEEETRDVASRGIERFISVIAARFPKLPPREAKTKARGVVAAMVGGMMLSRIVTDSKLSDRFLRDTKNLIVQS